ncbi:glutathione peroxidase [Flavobacterium sp.]|uniref:glutathione peroxidase n=1 Tax=Flavobacterium sp. TaxID=239 RepID=UPI003753501C
MKFKSLLFISLFALISCNNQAQTAAKSNKKEKLSEKIMTKETIYQFKVKDLEGNLFDFSTLKGKKILIVNTASKCGLTPQYAELEELYKNYSSEGFVVIGFPANNFASQEPGTDSEIGAFCQKNYGVTFPMMSKVSVKGNDMCDLYKFLTQKSKNGLKDSDVEWNFQKYLINEKGELETVIAPNITPMSEEIVSWVKA